ncbi:MAG TPA: hypothetical protein VE935_00885 [Burkholderiales bacterium]|jgi:hypothetical protein|nr:hypothetical protein [Burkholderiales bacterium]
MLVARLPAQLKGRIRLDAKHLERRQRNVARAFAFLKPRLGLESVFMEVGCGDCALSRKIAGDVERVYALEVSEDLMGRLGGPPNLVRIVHDGVRIPVPEGVVDFAYSTRLVISQLPGICHALKDGGVYWSTSKGPAAELRAAYYDAGFSRVCFYVGGLRVPYLLARVLDDPFRIAAVK